MILGMNTFALVHVFLSLICILSGLVIVFAMLASKLLPRWTMVFLITAVLTTVTGFLFPFHKFLPSHVFGIISSIALPIAIFALYGRKLAGSWRWIYVVTAVLSLYLNVFILIVQLFEKIPALKPLAPTQSEPPFKYSQLSCLILFVLLGIAASIRFRPAPASAI